MSLDSSRIRLIMELRREGITDARVLGAIERVPREVFVPETFRHRAYENTPLPIDHGQTISQPAVVAYMTQALEVGPRMKVLEIGTGSGYQAAILAKLCRRVYTIERYKSLLQEAESRFRHLRINNITAICGDGTRGWPEQAPFDRIIVTAAASRSLPEEPIRQLAPDGIMIAPMGSTTYDQHLYKIRFDENGEVRTERLWPVRFVPLVSGDVANGS